MRYAYLMLFLVPTLAHAEGAAPLLLQKPTINGTHVVFVYGDDLWRVPRQGGDAVRLTSGPGSKIDPVFSPDGTQVAFTADYDGNADVYVIAATGGTPRRLTYHPAADRVVGWTPDGKNVLFRSNRSAYSRFTQLFTVPVAGGFPTPLPLPMGYEGSYSPDGMRMAYVPIPPAFSVWKRYRGGRATPVWLANLADSHIEKMPRQDSNDFNPMWVGDRIYFLSDRNGPFTLFSYESGGDVRQVLPNDGFDIKSASAGAGVIVYEQFGAVRIFDPQSGRTQAVDVRLAADLSGLRPRFVKAAKHIQNADISPTGARAVFEARGEIFTAPAEKGDVRNLTNTPAVAERDPAWSPDGKSIAYFSDQSGEYQLHVREARGFSPPKTYGLGKAPSFYYSPAWSPDGKKIAYSDKRLNNWYLDLASGKSTLIDTDTYDDRVSDLAWSSDSRWLTYTKGLKSHLRAVFVYGLESGKSHQLTDGMSDARSPAFDANGKYLYFAASTDAGPTLGWEMSAIGRPVTRSVYVVVLRDDLPSPLAPQSDEERDEAKSAEASAAKAKKVDDKKGDKKAEDRVRIDFEDIGQRILALPVPARNYVGLARGKAGVIFLLEGPPNGLSADQNGPPRGTLHRFDLEERKTEKLGEGISEPHVSADGEKLLYHQGETWFIVPSSHPAKPGEGALKLEAMEVRVDPRAEWKQMYREVWRIERDFLYDPGFHGLDLRGMEKKYEPYLDNLAGRRDWNYLVSEMLGELTLGHVYIIGGDEPERPKVKGGLLGADYSVENGRYRFARVYFGENWNPDLRAPLTQPGTKVRVGEYLLAVEGRDLRPPENLYQRFEGTAGRAVVIKVGPNPDGRGAREVTVVPVESETTLRNLAWIADNRRKVDQLSGGRVAYVYVPDTSVAGFTSFVRYFFPQAGKAAAVIDERFNSGGIVPDYIVDSLRRPLIGWITTREGEDATLPLSCILGPKVMITNEFAGSGGDELPHYFRQTRTGTLVGKRTWGGLVGIGDYPTLMDGGIVTAPNAAFWFPSGKWEVENHGVDPDVEVEYDPEAVRAGHDPQLERAVAIALGELAKNPARKPHRPDYPNYHRMKAAPVPSGDIGSSPGRR